MIVIIIERNKNLDGQAVYLFKNALEPPQRSDLFKHYIAPNLYTGSHYIYTTPDPVGIMYKNWRPEITALAIELYTIAPCGVQIGQHRTTIDTSILAY